MNRETFFSFVRNAPFGGRISTQQLNGMIAILNYWLLSGLTDVRWLAYMLATVFHETGATMQPIREAFGKTDADTIAKLDRAYAAGQLKWVKTPYWRPDKNGIGWFGRGLVQLTHYVNYARLGKILNIPLDTNPSLALKMDIAVAILFEGMTHGTSSKGDFTGKSLEDYFNLTVDDPLGARKIINGTDKKKLIAGYYKNFLDAINAAIEAQDDGVKNTPAVVEAAKPDDVPVKESKSLWTILLTIFTGGGAAVVKEVADNGSNLLNAVNNPWAALSLLSLVGGGVLVWLIYTGRITINRTKAIP